jgi:hypothetical protein
MARKILPGLGWSVSSHHVQVPSPCAACQSCTVPEHALAHHRRDTAERRDTGDPRTVLIPIVSARRATVS